MSNLIGTPDGQYGYVAPQQLLKVITYPATTANVPLPSNVESVLVFLTGSSDASSILVVGHDSGIPFPVIQQPHGSLSGGAVSFVSTVSAADDASLDLTVVGASTGSVVFIADSGVRIIADAMVNAVMSKNAATAGNFGLQVMGWDGSLARLVATDANGHILTVDQTLKLAIAAIGAAIPADAVMVGVSDGTDIRALLGDSSGHAFTIDQNLKNAIAALAAAIPADAVLSGVSDGTDIRAMRADAQGIIYDVPSAPNTAAGDRPLNELLYADANGISATTTLIAAPGANKHLRLFLLKVAVVSVGGQGYTSATYGGNTVYHVYGSNAIAANPVGDTMTFPLTGLKLDSNTAVTANVNSGTLSFQALYTIEND